VVLADRSVRGMAVRGTHASCEPVAENSPSTVAIPRHVPPMSGAGGGSVSCLDQDLRQPDQPVGSELESWTRPTFAPVYF
jgi:hypothetical protein